LAAIPFEPATGAVKALGTRAEWLAKDHYAAMAYAAWMLEKTPPELAEFTREMGIESMKEILTWFETLGSDFKGYAEALGSVHARLLIAMARTTLEPVP
jgi:hypothetical protein